jgi:aldehyde:ferredoxin oxidoreductase
MEYYGYAGKIMHVDLSTGKVEDEPLDVDLARKYLGGWGLSNRLMWDLLGPGINPLAPEIPIILGAGPLCGTIVPGSNKCTSVYKRPILAHRTEEKYIVSVAVGGTQRFSAMLKHAGYDIIIITGRASKPCYLYIGSDMVRINDASDLWGKDVYETSEELVKRHKKTSGGCGVWTIGRAGENLVKWAHAFVDKRGTLGRFGGGAVLGSKNLKAVVTWGNKGIKIFDPKRFMGLVEMKRDEILNVPGWGLNWPPYGGGAISKEYPKEIYDKTKVCKTACMGCFGPEWEVFQIKDGPLAGTTMQGSGLFIVRDFGRLLRLQDYRESNKLVDLITREGLCVITGMKMLHFVTGLYERGIISAIDIGGFELKRGNFESYVKLIDMIVRKKHIGEVVAEGWYTLGRKVGMDALDDFKYGVAVVKGGDVLLDARFSRLAPSTLGNITFSKPQHTHSAPHYSKDASLFVGIEEEVKPFLQTLDGIKWDFANRMATTRADFERVFSEDSFNIGRFAKHAEDCKAVYNSLGICDISPYGFKDPTRDIPFLAEIYFALTGLQISPHELKGHGEAIWNLDRMINAREGFGREDDQFPEAWVKNTEMPVKLRQGDSYLSDWFGRRLNKKDLKQILSDYYDERGWDIETGIPTKKTLMKLELEEYSLE